MVHDGNNFAMHHSALFYVCFIAAMITATVLMLGLFLLMVGRASQVPRRATADAEAAGPERPALDEAPAEPPATEPASAGPVPAVSAGATPHAA